MRLVAAGVSYRTAPLRARERAAASVVDPSTALRFLVGHAGLDGAAVLSTCNRTEFYVTCPERVAPQVAPRLARYLDPGNDEGLAEHLESRQDTDAAAHLFRVAAGLESMVVGEAQVLGQLKDAHRAAREAGTLDARLDFVLRRAITVGKRVRTETALGRGAGSMGDLALDAAERAIGGLHGRGVLLLGAGAMSTLAAARLRELGCRVFVASRSGSSAKLAAQVGGRPVSPAQLDSIAAEVDVVLSSTSSRRPVLTAADVARLQGRRQRRPLCIIDLAVPRDVEPAAGDVPGVTLLDIDHLEVRAISDDPQAEAAGIINAELERTMRALAERDAVTPTIAALQRRAERVRRDEVERTLARVPGLDDPTRERIEAMTQSMMRKLLHAPIAHLRHTKDDPAVALTMREAFDLES